MILITGAGGFIGRRLCARLNAAGWNIVPLYHAEDAVMRGDAWALDLAQPRQLSLLKTSIPAPETVIHLAGDVEIVLEPNLKDPSSAPLPGKEDVARTYTANVSGTAALLDFCLTLGVRHLIFASSQAVYGMPQERILTEESPCAPLEHYAVSKLCCEQLLEMGARQGIAVTILRLPGVFDEERKSGIVYNYCATAIRSKRIQVTSDFPLPLDVIHLDDVVAAFEKAVQYGGQNLLRLNIATGEPCNLDILADSVAELVHGCQVKHGRVPQPVVQMDPSRAYEVLQWRSRPRHERLASMLERVRNAG